MSTRYTDLIVAVGLLFAIGPAAVGQVAYPDHTIQDVEWTSGTHHTAVTQQILSPAVPTAPVSISASADVEFVSGTQIHLTDGFHAGEFTGNGRFRARIDESPGPNGDVVVISPEPATHMVNNVLHIEKWEKLEIGLQLPQDYSDAITRFFSHYYSNGDTNIVTPNMVDPQHDLNPYADDSLQLVITLISPSGVQKMKWGFFMKEATWANTADTAWLVENLASPLHPYSIRFRLAPDEEGLWQFELSAKATHTTSLSNGSLPPLRYTGYGFACDPALPDNKGFLHVNEANRRTLQFETGESFFGLGTNLADIGDHQIDHRHIREAMEGLHSAGGNFLRMWLMRHQFAPEWVNLGVYDHYREEEPCTGWTGPARHLGNGQYQCWFFDQVLDHARENDMYIQLCIDPNGPGIAYEIPTWGSNPYVIHFVEPSSPTRPYDLKEYFYKDGDPTNTDNGVFYYWKRKYKYILARWGYSVNIAAIEPFNETDQMLSYYTRSLANPYAEYNTICPENRVTWAADTSLPITINNWLTDITHFVKDPVEPSHLESSPLGEDRKLFLMSYTGGEPANTSVPNYFLPFSNPNVDLIDVHRGLIGNPDLKYSLIQSAQYRDTYTSNGHKKPFHQGEFTTYKSFKYNVQPDSSVEIANIYDNYDVSFHNEIWASTFFGNFAAGTSWHWAPVFWWEISLPRPPKEEPTSNPIQQFHSNIKGFTNYIYPNQNIVPVINKSIFHNFKPLSDMLKDPAWQQYSFINEDHTAHVLYDDQGDMECYYLLNADSTMAIGWVHNLNAYWNNHFYVKSPDSLQNYLGCSAPNSQVLWLDGFQPGAAQYVTYYPTRMNSTVHPVDQLDDDGDGSLLLDLTTAPLGGILNSNLDTLHADYGFIITPQPLQRRMIGSQSNDTIIVTTPWSFSMYPNPASDAVRVLLPEDGVSRDIALHDLTGKCVYARRILGNRIIDIPVGSFAKGPYCVRVLDADRSQMKMLIIH